MHDDDDDVRDDDWRTGALDPPAERFVLAVVRGDVWPDPADEPDDEPAHGDRMPGWTAGPYGDLLEGDDGSRR